MQETSDAIVSVQQASESRYNNSPSKSCLLLCVLVPLQHSCVPLPLAWAVLGLQLQLQQQRTISVNTASSHGAKNSGGLVALSPLRRKTPLQLPIACTGVVLYAAVSSSS